jgi:Fe(3+) dicitrate transport protein
LAAYASLAFVHSTPGLEHAALVLPGIGSFFALTDAFGLLAGAYRGYSPPAPGADPSVRPELSVNYEGGARFLRGRARVEVIGFYNDYSNLTDVCTLSSGCDGANLDRQFDAGKAHIYGLEAFAEHEIPVGPLKIPASLSYTFTRAKFTNAFTSDDPIFGDVHVGDEIPYVPRHELNVMLGLEGARAGGAISAMYISKFREVAGSQPLSETLATDEQFILDGSAFVRIYGPVRLYANVRNILNAHFIVGRRPYGARPNAPRWIQVGAKVDF